MNIKIVRFYLIYWGLIIIISIIAPLNVLKEGQKKESKEVIESKVTQLQNKNSLNPTKTATLTPKPTIKPSITPTKIVTPVKKKISPRVTISRSITRTPTKRPTPRPTKRPTPKPTKKVTKTVTKPSFKSSGRTYRVSAYDLSVQSCGKSRSSKNFGVTASGFRLANKSRTSAMTIAADLRILPLGTRVYIQFSSSRSRYNGYYTVRDTGGAIKGYKLDLFMGDGGHREAMNFGVQSASVRVIK